MDSSAVKILRSQDGGLGRAGGQKIENHHMVDCSHLDMFFRTEYHPEIDSARLGNSFCTVRQLGKVISAMGWKVAFLTVEASFHVKIIDFRGEKIEKHHMGDYRHIDIFSRTEYHPEIDCAVLEN